MPMTKTRLGWLASLALCASLLATGCTGPGADISATPDDTMSDMPGQAATTPGAGDPTQPGPISPAAEQNSPVHSDPGESNY